jgi:hypothetical protein
MSGGSMGVMVRSYMHRVHALDRNTEHANVVFSAIHFYFFHNKF